MYGAKSTWQSNAQGAACAKDKIHDKYIQKCNRKGTYMKGNDNQL